MFLSESEKIKTNGAISDRTEHITILPVWQDGDFTSKTSNNPPPVCLVYVVTLNTQLFTGLKLKLDGVSNGNLHLDRRSLNINKQKCRSKPASSRLAV